MDKGFEKLSKLCAYLWFSKSKTLAEELASNYFTKLIEISFLKFLNSKSFLIHKIVGELYKSELTVSVLGTFLKNSSFLKVRSNKGVKKLETLLDIKGATMIIFEADKLIC